MVLSGFVLASFPFGGALMPPGTPGVHAWNGTNTTQFSNEQPGTNLEVTSDGWLRQTGGKDDAGSPAYRGVSQFTDMPPSNLTIFEGEFRKPQGPASCPHSNCLNGGPVMNYQADGLNFYAVYLGGGICCGKPGEISFQRYVDGTPQNLAYNVSVFEENANHTLKVTQLPGPDPNSLDECGPKALYWKVLIDGNEAFDRQPCDPDPLQGGKGGIVNYAGCCLQGIEFKAFAYTAVGLPGVPGTPTIPGPGSVHVQHLSADYLDGLDSTAFASALHDHDDRYFTQAQSDARFAAAGHDHDGRYLELHGTASNAHLLGGLAPSQFLRSDRSGTVEGTLAVNGRLKSAGLEARESDGVPSVIFGDTLGKGYIHAGGDDVFMGTADGSKVVHIDQRSRYVGIGPTPPTDQLRPQEQLDVRGNIRSTGGLQAASGSVGSLRVGADGVVLLKVGLQLLTWDPPSVNRGDCITTRLGPLEGVVIGVDPPSLVPSPLYPSSEYNWNYQWTDFGPSGGGITSRSGGQGNPGTWVTVEFCQWLNEVGSYDPPPAVWRLYYLAA